MRRSGSARTLFVIVVTAAAAAIPLLATTHASGFSGVSGLGPGFTGLGGEFADARGGAGGDATGGTGDPAGDGGESIGGNGGIAFNVPLALPSSTTTTSTTSTTLGPTAVLVLTKVCNPTGTEGRFNCSAAVTNTGGAPATGVMLTDAVPDQMILLGNNCSELGGVVTCDVGSLDPGASASLDMALLCDVSGSVTNTAEVTSTNAPGSSASATFDCPPLA